MRLIDADVLPNYKLMGTATFGRERSPAELRMVLWEDIKSMSTIDAVPVVRCWECVSRGDSSNFPAMIYCKRLYCYKSPEGYCDEGQRKEADHEVSEL